MCVLPLSSLHDTQSVCYLSHIYTIHRVCASSLISTRYTECVLPLSSLHDTQSVCYLSHLYTIHRVCATSLISTRYTECVLPLSSLHDTQSVCSVCYLSHRLHDTQSVCYLSHLYMIHRVCATSLISTRYTECVLPLSSLHDTQ